MYLRDSLLKGQLRECAGIQVFLRKWTAYPLQAVRHITSFVPRRHQDGLHERFGGLPVGSYVGMAGGGTGSVTPTIVIGGSPAATSIDIAGVSSRSSTDHQAVRVQCHQLASLDKAVQLAKDQWVVALGPGVPGVIPGSVFLHEGGNSDHDPRHVSGLPGSSRNVPHTEYIRRMQGRTHQALVDSGCNQSSDHQSRI